MRPQQCFALIFALALSAAPAMLPAQDDAAGCKDHPLFTRMPGYYIAEYQESPFNSFSFTVRDPDIKRT